VKFTVTVMMTSTGTPFSRVGENNHCLTASSAAWSSSGCDRRIFVFVTLPSGRSSLQDDRPSIFTCFAIGG
jgi:hypothetical protein